MTPFTMGGLGWNLGTIATLSHAQTRSISAENFSGAKGRGGMATEGATAGPARFLGPGWKVSPCVLIKPRETFTLAEIDGPGVIQHIWITTAPENWRRLVLRMYWDGEDTPSVEAPLGDFFCQSWNVHSQISSIPIAVNPRGALNSYWPMPFSQSARITVENLVPDDLGMFFYQVTYALTEIPENTGRFHAQFRRTNPVPHKQVHTIVDGIRGHGHYAGTFMAWQANNTSWWGEGEIKFFMDGDGEYPTICGTGTEDYFGGAWGFEEPPGTYKNYTTPFLGFCHDDNGGERRKGNRFGMYRWHIPDPIIFHEDLRVTIQALGIGGLPVGGEGRFVTLQDDVASVAFWYQAEPHAPYPVFPDFDALEVT